MLEYIKEKIRLSVYKAIIVKKVGETEIKTKTIYEYDPKTGVPEKKTITLDNPILVARYRILKVKYVNPNREYFKYTVGGFLSRNKVTKNLPVDFSFEAYSHNEKHVLFIDWDSGAVVELGGGQIQYAYPPEEDAVKSSLVRSVGDLMRGKQDTMMLILALGCGVFLGIFIQNTLIPLLGAI